MVQDQRLNINVLNTEKDYLLFVNGEEIFFESFESAQLFSLSRCAKCHCIIKNTGGHLGDHNCG